LREFLYKQHEDLEQAKSLNNPIDCNEEDNAKHTLKASYYDDEVEIEDDDVSFSERIQNHEHMIKRVHLYSKNRPVYGILTEPLRGDISKGDADLAHMKEYIPASHV
jgi:hypothetical protein